MDLRRIPDPGRQRGVVLIWLAFFLLFLLGFIALGIDAAKLMATRTQLQNAADAGALAGASAINPETGAIVQDTAVVRAIQVAGENKAFRDGPEPVVVAGSDVTFPTVDRVRVVARRSPGTGGSMVTHVAQVIGVTSLEMQADATAEVSPASEVCERLVPMGAIPPGGTEFQTGCANEYTLLQGQGDGANGNWQALSFPSCGEGPCQGMPARGSSTFRCLLENGYGCCVQVGQIVDTEPGQMNGPVRQGLQARWDADTDTRSNICYTEYTGNGQRVVNVPIISPMGNGRTDVQVLGFAAFFLKSRPVGGPAQPIVAEFIRSVAPGGSSGTPPQQGTTYTLRLVE